MEQDSINQYVLVTIVGYCLNATSNSEGVRKYSCGEQTDWGGSLDNIWFLSMDRNNLWAL
jgi:hypothetical protein